MESCVDVLEMALKIRSNFNGNELCRPFHSNSSVPWFPKWVVFRRPASRDVSVLKKKNLARVFIFLVCEKEISIFPFSLSCLFGGCSWVGRRRRGRRAAGGADRRDRGHRSAAAENDARSAGQEEEECGVQDGGRRRRRDGAAAAARRRLGLGRRLRFLHDPRRRYICEPRPFFHFFWGGGHRIEESIAEWSTLFSKQFRRKQTVRFVSVKGRKGVLSSFTGFYLFLMGFTGF